MPGFTGGAGTEALLRALWTFGGEGGEGGDGGAGSTAGPGWIAELRRLLVRPLCQLLPRWWWGRRRTRRLAERFGARPFTLEYTPGGRGGGLAQGQSPKDGVARKESIGEPADAVCERITANPRTVVYWASRALQFSAFLDDFGDNTACEGRKLTVLGGSAPGQAGGDPAPHRPGLGAGAVLRRVHPESGGTDSALGVEGEVLMSQGQLSNHSRG
ncbi:hypothetical protein ACWDWU_38045 [Streptomyces sp. NPDC003442]